MNELALLSQIETLQPLLRFTAFEPGIWRCALYVTGTLLPFMKDTYNREIIKVNNVLVNHLEIYEYDNLDKLRNLPGNEAGWVNGGSIIYIRLYDWNPPILFFSLQYGILQGFTNNKPVYINGIMYRPGLLYTPAVEDSSDAFAYDKMKFSEANIDIDNINGNLIMLRTFLEMNLIYYFPKPKKKKKKII